MSLDRLGKGTAGGGLTTASELVEVALGNVAGQSANIKFGRNESVGTSFENINDQGGTYTYSSSAVTHYISSSSTSDTDQTIYVEGIDANGDIQSQTVALAGQTKTAISGTWLRVYRAYVQTGSDLVGTVYIYEDDTVTSGVPQTATKQRAQIKIGNNQTQMAQFSTPNDLYMVVHQFTLTSGKDNNMEFQARIRPTDASAPWRVIFNHDIYRTTMIQNPLVPYVIPPNYDIEVRARVGAGTSAASCDWGFILRPL